MLSGLLLVALGWGIVAASVLLTHGPSLPTFLMIVASGACAAISAPGLFSATSPRDTEPPPATSQGALLAYLLVGWIGWSAIPLFALHLTSDIVLGRSLTAIVLDGSVLTCAVVLALVSSRALSQHLRQRVAQSIIAQ